MILFLTLFLSSLALADDPSFVQVTGRCEMQVVPDRGRVSFTAENQFKDQKEAVKKTNAQINQLKEKIKALKLQGLELKTTAYNVLPVREYEKEVWVQKGTRASMTLEVTTSDIPRLGEAMTEASKVGIQIASELQTYLSNAKTKQEYLKCLDIAAEDARAKGQQLAKKLGFKLGDVIKLIESPQPVIPPMPVRGMMMAKSAGAMESASVEAGQQQFTTTIEVSFRIK